ncbi:hypothetical protein ACFX13_047439 [Malus domestica]|uniref:uncharacterized protein n=1 Tax=Malus domestica TaxID=3750 RepID=UPI0039770C22
MEATEEQGAEILHRILPPRLEDAGLEDCALPPDSIKEAFLKAATAVKSSIFTSDEDEESFEDCVNDPWPDLKDRTGELVGAEPETRSAGPCGEEEKGDKVIVGGEDVRDGGGDRDCVDGLAGLEIGEKVKKGEEEEKDGGGGPILVGGYV